MNKTVMRRLERKWINQPSLNQCHHNLHGKRVIYDVDAKEVWFTDGDIISQQMNPDALSDGWPDKAEPAVRKPVMVLTYGG